MDWDQAVAVSLVHQNSVPSVQMHRRITAILPLPCASLGSRQPRGAFVGLLRGRQVAQSADIVNASF